jgi:membrane protein DedA with SNARE-associated domain
MFKMFITAKIVGSITRHVLTAAGGYLAAQGLVDPVADGATLEAITGGAVALAGLAMSMIEKYGRV